ncbi:hypothetical protein A2230_01445 [candidate division WOR-1 bacterium RIFOXYA2_FULL_36_21]|uniref:Phage-Barnase-EndoU-ColicinE5/D-RelE like nuclease 2 domain-containing protein n=1 Tax=candidate division WOR-1 bacterium RIFOXYB2_FULL_36_35 TaxID=1802578 RepID=A0A1F4S890_UNCSA|nr:MAG: hypothetical protein A2230_01445 [candidate division WOR-1 bacterium RIFOXYA2_FULL_36_21]OGC14361.1 MAG: hypothetical protein A2282_07910 [candidate division WOR-1 bacterium RIFOXYA12_FULL_36_13]OGC15963.1 MAG: hypothetical protein A2290_06915 [candidate division WOR-1 bacterium RIFOXYB2_FULL_36_35]
MVKHYKTVFGEKIYLTDDNWRHVVERHPEVETYLSKIEEVLKLPDFVKLSRRDSSVHLYYKFYHEVYKGKYILVVVNNSKKYISTIFITDKIKLGETIWIKK